MSETIIKNFTINECKNNGNCYELMNSYMNVKINKWMIKHV